MMRFPNFTLQRDRGLALSIMNLLSAGPRASFRAFRTVKRLEPAEELPGDAA